MRSNIGKILQYADDVDIREGKKAYWRYRYVIENFANYYEVPFDRALAAFVALSPNNDYYGNLRSLASVLGAVKHGYDIDTVTVTTFNSARDRAYSYATGEVCFLSTSKGRKTRSFYHNIKNPLCKKHVTVDGHMIAAYFGGEMSMKEANLALRKVGYDRIEQSIKSLAKRHDLIPCQLQAIVWLTRKRLFNIVYSSQIDLFQNKDDLTRTIVSVDDTPPYKRKVI